MKLLGLNIQSKLAMKPILFLPLRKSLTAALQVTVANAFLPCSLARASIAPRLTFPILDIVGITACLSVMVVFQYFTKALMSNTSPLISTLVSSSSLYLVIFSVKSWSFWWSKFGRKGGRVSFEPITKQSVLHTFTIIFDGRNGGRKVVEMVVCSVRKHLSIRLCFIALT